MGLGAYRTAWKRQTRYFGHHHGDTYSSLVFDNRGMGKSDKPGSRYSTSELARDVVDLLLHLGWLQPGNDDTKATQSGSNNTSSLSVPEGQKLNIIGVSMGGMIAQELAIFLPPQTINSLSLVSTAPRLVRTVPFIENLRQRINMFIPRDIDVQLDEIAHRLFGEEFLTRPDTEADEEYTGGPEGGNFPKNWDRYCAGELEKRRDLEGYTRKGFMLQAIAAGWHHKSPQQIKELADKVGRERIAVLHGTGDRMITFKHAELLKEELGEGIEWRTWEGRGHVLCWEEEEEFNRLIEAMVRKGEGLR